MKLRRLLILLSTFLLVVLVGNLIQYRGQSNVYSVNYPPVSCPNAGAGTTLQVSLTNSKELVRSLPGKSTKFLPAKSTRISSDTKSLVVDGEGVNSLAWISKSGVWAGGVTCLSPQTEQYFVGASGDVSSKSNLILVNSGLNNSIVELTVFTEATTFKKTVLVNKNRSATVSMVSLAPGSKSLGLRVVPKTGRVSAFLVDERGKGLKTLGGDLVNSQIGLSKTLLIPAIAHSANLSKTHILRILNPNLANANISVEVISSDGRYVPIGLDSKIATAERAVDISFDLNFSGSVFGLKLSADQPIAAAVYSKVQSKGKSDFVWSTSVKPGVVGTWAITGLDPLLVVTGDSIKISAKVILPGGKNVTKTLTGSDITAYRIPSGALGLQILSISSDCAAALLVNSQSGTGYFPLINGSVLTRSTVPTANIGVLNP